MSFADFFAPRTVSWQRNPHYYNNAAPQSWASFPMQQQQQVRRQPQRTRNTGRPVDGLFGYPGGFDVEDYDPEGEVHNPIYRNANPRQLQRKQPQRQQQQHQPSTSAAIRSKPAAESELLRRERQRLANKARTMQLNACARCIQRWYRAQLQVKAAAARAEHYHAAALTIQRFFTDVVAIQRAKQVKAQLRALADVQHSVQEVCDQYMSRALHGPLHDDRGRVRRDILVYEEGLTKSLLALDNVSTLGNEVVRSRRKDIVTHIQGLLNELDAYREGCRPHDTVSNAGGFQRMQTD